MRYCCFLLMVVLMLGCGKSLDVGVPDDRMVPGVVFASDATAAAVLTGVYYTMSNGGAFSGEEGLSFNCGLSADEYQLMPGNPDWEGIWQNSLTSLYAPFWRQLYYYIYVANSALERLDNATALTPAVQRQLMGESYFIRAVCYWYLVNLFGDVPLLTGTDAQVNKSVPRMGSESVYNQVVDDLIRARALLSKDFLRADITTIDQYRVRPTIWAATAFLSRVYLYRGSWAAAKAMADTLIDQQDLFALEPLNKVFLRTSHEAIWQLEPVNVSYTKDGYLFNFTQPVYASTFLLAAFEKGDRRQSAWLNRTLVDGDTYYYPYKYKAYKDTKEVTECLTVLRLGEVYLNRAEALVRLGDLAGAKADVDVIRARAGLSGVEMNGTEDMLLRIWGERQVELFSEMGHRWLDLKRSGQIRRVMQIVTPTKGGVWADYQALYPIPASERQLNTALTQNEGY